jgi:hypothetical protein
VEEALPHNPQENDSNEDDTHLKYYECHFFSREYFFDTAATFWKIFFSGLNFFLAAITQAEVRVLLFGQPIEGAPFMVDIIDEAEIFTKCKKFQAILGDRVEMDDKLGVRKATCFFFCKICKNKFCSFSFDLQNKKKIPFSTHNIFLIFLIFLIFFPPVSRVDLFPAPSTMQLAKQKQHHPHPCLQLHVPQ